MNTGDANNAGERKERREKKEVVCENLLDQDLLVPACTCFPVVFRLP